MAKKVFIYSTPTSTGNLVITVVSKKKVQADEYVKITYPDIDVSKSFLKASDTTSTIGVVVETKGVFGQDVYGGILKDSNPLSKESVDKAVTEMDALKESDAQKKSDDECDCISCRSERGEKSIKDFLAMLRNTGEA